MLAKKRLVYFITINFIIFFFHFIFFISISSIFNKTNVGNKAGQCQLLNVIYFVSFSLASFYFQRNKCVQKSEPGPTAEFSFYKIDFLCFAE